jgi:hypothetical protein
LALLKIGGCDPSLTHTGLAKATFDLETGDWSVEKVSLVITDSQAGKTVRKNSDDLRRAQLIGTELHAFAADCDVLFAEIPTGSQSARAMFAFGAVIGILGTLTTTPGFRPSFMQLLPREVKLAVPGGSASTSKEEIVDWAATNWPNAGWTTHAKGKFPVAGVGKLTADCEHMGDACAIINAGVRTQEFRNLLTAFRIAKRD